MRPALELSLPLVLAAGALGAALAAAGAWTIWDVTDDALERSTEATLAGASARAESVLAERAARIERALDALALPAARPARERWAAGGRDAVEEASHWAPLVGLDVLEAIDGQGRVVSSAHWPERAGIAAGPLGRLLPGQPVVVAIEGREGRLLALVERERGIRPGRTVVLVGGLVLDASFVQEIAGEDAALLLADRIPAIALPEAMDLPIEAALELEARLVEPASPSVRAWDETAPARLRGERRSWSARALDLAGPAGEIAARLVVAVDRTPIEAVASRALRRGALAVGVAAVSALAAGSILAHRLARRASAAARAVGQAAAGEADYSVALPVHDPLDELPAAASRLRRSLDLEQQRSLAAERVAAWREVARRVAHEVKNPLVPIRLTMQNLERARREAPQLFDAMFEEGTRVVLEEVEQLRRLVAEFSEFARLPEPARRSVDLHALIDDVLELYAGEPDLVCTRRYDERLPLLPLDRDQIGRALKNVIGNAVEATREPGAHGRRIEVRTAVEGGMARVEVADSGPGFPGGAPARIFDAYFTTKREGTGLGLAITYRIVVEHGGLIEADGSGLDGGARVVIRLPLATGDEKPGRASA